MKINEKIQGFTVERIRELEELNGELIEMTHNKTQLKLAWIKRNEQNKTFGISFKTLPFDDTGVFHILEHSVLCGSEKYPVKEPFVELLKSSMNTFLNALTFPDKTMYPISSRNDKDFINLMRVYLDAVFCPSIYTKPEIFYQEGWHYEVDESNNYSYKGVVFNEMKGALAGADELEEIELNRALFPDSPYSFVSGGDPKSIPDLSYENFVDTHKKFYSPSNAYIFLDGDVDIERTLEIIDGEYLAKMEKGERIPAPVMQKPVSADTRQVEFEIGEEEELDGKTRIAWGNMIGSFDEREKIIAMQVLTDTLCGSNQSLLSKKVLESGLAEDITMQLNDGIAQPWLKIEAQNIKNEDTQRVEELIFSELKALADNGIDKSQLEASMANLEFQMRERDFGSWPQGLIYGFQLMECWLYDGDPITNLQVGNLFEQLKNKLDENYFETLINEIILNNPHSAKVVLTPSHTAGESRRLAEANRIAEETASLSDEEKEDIINKQKKLLSWQSSEDTPEQLATIPQLKLDDISATPEDLPTEIIDKNGIKTLFHDINCSGIANVALYFDADNLNEEEICELSFLTDILGKIKTSTQSEEELDKKTRILFGALNFFVSSHPDKYSNDICSIKLAVTFGTLEQNLEKALEFVAELLCDTQLDDESVALDILKQLKTKYFQQFIMSGSGVGMGRISAQCTANGVAKECAGGYEYYKWLCAQEKEWCWSKLSERLGRLLKSLVNTSGLTLSITGSNKTLTDTATSAIKASSIPQGAPLERKPIIKPWGKRKEGIIIPADIAFACAGGQMPNFTGFDGSMNIASKIISLAYLWNVVRVQGGAYGAGFAINRNGLCVSYSYRDPASAQTLEAYKGIADFIDDFCKQDANLTGFIIGAISSATPLLTPKARGYKADENYWCGISYEDRYNLINEMITATPEKITALADDIRTVYDDSCICVVGGKNQLENSELDKIYYL